MLHGMAQAFLATRKSQSKLLTTGKKLLYWPWTFFQRRPNKKRGEGIQLPSPQDKIIETVCQGCHVTCGVLVHVSEGRITKIEGNPDHPLSRGMMCPKGLAYKQVVYHPDRLKYPLKRVGKRGENKWERISWDEALDMIARRFSEFRDTHGPESIVAVVGGNPGETCTQPESSWTP